MEIVAVGLENNCQRRHLGRDGVGDCEGKLEAKLDAKLEEARLQGRSLQFPPQRLLPIPTISLHMCCYCPFFVVEIYRPWMPETYPQAQNWRWLSSCRPFLIIIVLPRLPEGAKSTNLCCTSVCKYTMSKAVQDTVLLHLGVRILYLRYSTTFEMTIPALSVLYSG
jgi:hypothetical protein